MTWNGTDSARLVSDQACIPLGVQIQNDLADSAVARTGQVSRTWLDLANYRVPFSTPSDSWRTIPFIIPKQGYTDALSFRIRYLLDATGSSGITAGATGGDIRVRVNGVNSSATTVVTTGTTTAEATITISTAHVSSAALVVGEIQFMGLRGSAGATWDISQMIRSNQLVATNITGTTPVTASAPHLEFDFGAAGVFPEIAHICQAEAGSDGTLLARVWPFITEGDELPWGDGKLQTFATYNLPPWTLLSVSIEATASANLIPPIPSSAIQAGVGTRTGAVNALVGSLARVIHSRANVYTIGPAMGTGTQTYLTGMRTGSTAKTTVGGAYIDRPSEEFGVTVLALICPRWSEFAGAPITLTLDMERRTGGAGSDSSTVDFFIAPGSEARTTFDGDGTLHQFNTGNVTRSKWSPADTGAEGDCDRLQIAVGQIDYNGDAGDLHELIVSLTGVDTWVGALAVYGRVRI